MPTLGELGDLPKLLSNSLISTSHLWKREASEIKQLDLLLFLHQYKHTNLYGKACREVNLITGAGIDALITGELDVAEFAFFEHPKVFFTSDEFCEWMSEVSDARRNAILFALEMDLDPKVVIGLRWKDLTALSLTPVSQEIISNQVRHLNLKYVFWEFLTNGSAAPLFGLSESAAEVSQGLPFQTLRELYQRMVITDSQTTLKAFLKQIELHP